MEIAVISGKGGTGKSSLVAAFASLSEKVVLADCDVDAANLYILFDPSHDEEEVFVSGQKAVIEEDICTSCGLCINYCRFDAIGEKDGRVKIFETACDGCGLCEKVCPLEAIEMVNEDKSRMYSGSFRHGKMVYGRLAPGEENSGKLVNMVRAKAKKIAGDCQLDILIDGPPGIGCAAISAITGVDKVLIVTEPSVSGLHDMKRTLEITDYFGLGTSVIINKYDLNECLSSEIEHYCRNRDISIAGKIPFNRLMVDAMINCKSVVEFVPEDELTQIIKESFQTIIG